MISSSLAEVHKQLSGPTISHRFLHRPLPPRRGLAATPSKESRSAAHQNTDGEPEFSTLSFSGPFLGRRKQAFHNQLEVTSHVHVP